MIWGPPNLVLLTHFFACFISICLSKLPVTIAGNSKHRVNTSQQSLSWVLHSTNFSKLGTRSHLWGCHMALCDHIHPAWCKARFMVNTGGSASGFSVVVVSPLIPPRTWIHVLPKMPHYTFCCKRNIYNNAGARWSQAVDVILQNTFSISL